MPRILLIILVVVQFLIHPICSYSRVVDEIAAVVNNDVITQSEINEILKPIYNQYKSAYSDGELTEKVEEARKNILNQMIEDKLMIQQAKDEGIEVKDDEIQEKLDQVKSQFTSEEEFNSVLKSQKLTIMDLKEKYKEQLMIKKLINREVRSKIEIVPTEVYKYYQDHIEELRIPPKVKVQTILIRKTDKNLSQTPTPKERIDKIKRALDNGEDFAKLAKEYSEDPSAANGGNMGYINKGEMMGKIDKLLFSLKVGQVSDIIETKVGYHIFKVIEKKKSVIKSFKEVRSEIENKLFQKKAQARFEKWIDGLKENAYISIK